MYSTVCEVKVSEYASGMSCHISANTNQAKKKSNVFVVDFFFITTHSRFTVFPILVWPISMLTFAKAIRQAGKSTLKTTNTVLSCVLDS